MFPNLLTAILLALPSIASAQIVNMQSTLAAPVEDGAHAQLEIRHEGKSGNTDTERYAGQGILTYKTGANLWLLSLKREYSTESDVSSSDNHFAHLRYSRQLNDNWFYEAYGQEDADRFRRSAKRTLWGTGPRYQDAFTSWFTYAVGIAYMEERETFSQNAQEVVEPRRVTKRLSQVVLLRWNLEEWGTLTNVTYYQPELGHLYNNKTLNDLSLSFLVNRYLSYKLTHMLAYNARPPEGVQKADRSFLQSLVLKF